MAPQAARQQQRIPASFQLLIALYIILTGAFPTIMQAFAFGLQGGAESEFATAMVTQTVRDLLLVLPLVLLSNHPLGILHPLILALVAWPLLRDIPDVIENWGGWAGILSGTPVTAPYFNGLPTRAASAIWTAIAKYNALQILSLVSIYTGFWMLKGKGSLSRLPPVLRNPGSVRTIMIGLIGLSLLVLIIFLRDRGGINEHLTSLGGGRFKELSQYGAVIVSINLGALALYVWIATNPSEIKSPIFLAALAAVAAAMFLSNGTRGGALEILMIVGLIGELRRQQIPWKIALVLIPFMFVSIGLLGAVRTSSWSGSTAGKAFENANWSESFALAEKEVQVRNATSAPVPVVARGFDLTGGLLLGRSYVGAVAAFIPRTIWPDKPRGVGSLYAQLFLGASKSGTTIPVSPEAEMYWNFGIPGLILLSIVYGAMLRWAYNLYWRHYPSAFATILYVLFITKFQFSSDKLIILEQRIVLLVICYTVLVMLVPKDRPWASRQPGQPLGAARSAA
jgi:oligosaccharide repeat unit polymerase